LLDEGYIQSLKGFLDPEEGRGLYTTALKASRFGPCLEIGSYCGKSAVYLGTACRENHTVLFSIDHHTGSEEQQPGETYFDPELFDYTDFHMDTFRCFRHTIKNTGLENTVIPIVSRSKTVAHGWSTPLSLVFIDGGHAYETVLTDYESWAPHIIKGGYLLIHDIFKSPEEGGQAPHEIYKKAISSGLFFRQPMIGTLGILKRK